MSLTELKKTQSQGPNNPLGLTDVGNKFVDKLEQKINHQFLCPCFNYGNGVRRQLV